MLNYNKTNTSLLEPSSSTLSSESSFFVRRAGPKSSQEDAQREGIASKKFHDDESSGDISSKKPRKQVTFKSRVRVKKVSSHKYYSTEDRANLWYNEEEMKQIRKEAVSTVKGMMRGIDVDDDEDGKWCSRGLENKTPKKNKARQAKKFEIIYSVLDEQDNQLIEADHIGGFVLNTEALANAYITAGTYLCAAEAALQGQKDEAAALL